MAIYKRGGVYWFSFVFDEKRVQKSTKQGNRKAAIDMESAHRTALAKGEVGIAPKKREKRTVGDLLTALEENYKQDGKWSPQNKSLLSRTRDDFGSESATALTSEDIEKYIARRRDAGARNASINRVTEVLRHAYKLAKLTPPDIKHQSEKDNVRTGFFGREEFDNLCAQLPENLRDFCHFAYLTGWRRNEIRTLSWSDYQERESTIRLRGENSKNGEPRAVPVTGELKAIIERRKQERFIDGVLTGFIFHRNGQPIGEFRKSWATACVAAGLGAFECSKCGEPPKDGERTKCRRCKRQRTYSGRIFHDFRRSAARNLIRAGVNEKVCMKLLGHKTRSIFDRYHIADETDLADAMQRLDKFHQETERKVVQIAK